MITLIQDLLEDGLRLSLPPTPHPIQFLLIDMSHFERETAVQPVLVCEVQALVRVRHLGQRLALQFGHRVEVAASHLQKDAELVVCLFKLMLELDGFFGFRQGDVFERMLETVLDVLDAHDLLVFFEEVLADPIGERNTLRRLTRGSRLAAARGHPTPILAGSVTAGDL